jgi:hypothetical protein
VLGNAGTIISFRVGAEDAPYLEQEFGERFDQFDLTQLQNHHIYLKLMIDGQPSKPFSATTLPPTSAQTMAERKDQECAPSPHAMIVGRHPIPSRRPRPGQGSEGFFHSDLSSAVSPTRWDMLHRLHHINVAPQQVGSDRVERTPVDVTKSRRDRQRLMVFARALEASVAARRI